MKKLIYLLAVLTAMALPAAAFDEEPTFVAVATFTPTGLLSTPFGFSNNSATLDIRIKRIEVAACSTGTIAGGRIAYWVYPSTTITTGGIAQVNTYSLSSPNKPAPTSVVASTGPVGAVIENAQTTNMPIATPCVVNNDEAATANFRDTCFDSFAAPFEQPIKLPARAHRGIFLEQRQQDPGNIAAGCVMVRVTYTSNPD